MRINFTPQRRDDSLTLEKSAGNRLRINGDLFNFNALNPGDSIPAGVVPCDWIVGPIEHVEGHVTLTLILPHGANPSAAVAFPEQIIAIDDGPIAVPSDPPPEEPPPTELEEPADVEP